MCPLTDAHAFWTIPCPLSLFPLSPYPWVYPLSLPRQHSLASVCCYWEVFSLVFSAAGAPTDGASRFCGLSLIPYPVSPPIPLSLALSLIPAMEFNGIRPSNFQLSASNFLLPTCSPKIPTSSLQLPTSSHFQLSFPAYPLSLIPCPVSFNPS